MSRRGALDVVVVGAGVVGAAAALAFARDGLAVAIVEPRSPPRWKAAEPDLRVYAFAPDNAALLEELDAWRSICAARVQPYRAMRVWDAAGGEALSFDADGFARRELGWIVEHALLVDRLWAALPAAGVQIHCPERVIGVEQGRAEFPQEEHYASRGRPPQDSGIATLDLESGLRLRTRLVVAADGGDSPLRALAGVGVATHDYGQRGLVAYVETEHPHQATCWQRFLPTGPLAFLPVATNAAHGTAGGASDQCSSIVWTLPDDEAARLLELDDAAFLVELGRAFDGPLGAMRAVSARAAFPLRRQLARSHVAGRVLLLGDAAHVVHPLAGQGVNLGLRDVASLRKSLRAAALRGDDIAAPARLDRWARERRSENAIAAQAFDGLNRLFSNDALLPTLLRGPLLGLAGRMPPVTRALWKRAAGL